MLSVMMTKTSVSQMSNKIWHSLKSSQLTANKNTELNNDVHITAKLTNFTRMLTSTINLSMQKLQIHEGIMHF